MTQTKRDYHLDLVRICAMFLIVLMHSPIPNSASGIIMSGVSYATMPGIGLFFMVSGALLLNNDMSQWAFMKKRFSKILWPTMFWTLFYLLIDFITNATTINHITKAFFNIPFAAQGNGVLWFMYTLAGLYLLTPILSKWLKSATKHEIEFYLLVWVATLSYPYLSLLGLNVNESQSGILYYFSGYAGYYLLGFYMKQYYRYKNWHFMAAILVGLLTPIIILVLCIEFDFSSLFGYLTIPIACLAFVYWLISQKVNISSERKLLTKTSSLCFGIYLIHIFVMRDIIWNLPIINSLTGLISIIIIALITFIASWIICFIINKLSFSKYIIGT